MGALDEHRRAAPGNRARSGVRAGFFVDFLAGMTWRIAVRNLLHDRIRLLVTLIGVIFAVVLISVQAGLFLGFTSATSCVIDHTAADVWIASQGVRNFDVTTPLTESKYYQVLSVPGVAAAKRFIVQFSTWKKPGGGAESVEVVGFDTVSGLGGPWSVVAGRVDLLKAPDTVIIDENYKGKLGVNNIGDEVEMRDRRARVVGFTRGVRSFTTSPYIFTSLSNALNYSYLEPDQFTYILVKAIPGVTPKALRDALRERVKDVDIFTTPEFSFKTQWYWMFTTGAGMALVIAAILGLIVGTVIVAQTLYATTMDHLPEFGTLKAMGAPNSYIYRIIIFQAVVSAVVGYGFGLAVSLFVVKFSEKGGASILLPWPMAVALFFLTIGMCVAAAVMSINKVTRIDPALVFMAR